MLIANEFRPVLALALVILGSSSSMAAKRTEPPKLIEQVPIIDTSILAKPSRFEIGITKTEVVPSSDSQALLQERLQALRLRVDNSKQLLQGKISQQSPQSMIETLEYGVQPQFYFDLFRLMPETAPELSRKMEAQLEESRRKLEGLVAQTERLMQQQLRARLTPLAQAKVVAAAPPAPGLSKQFQLRLAQSKDREPRLIPLSGASVEPAKLSEQARLQLAQSKERERKQVDSVKERLQSELERARRGAGDLKAPNMIPTSPSLPVSGVERETAATLQRAEREMQTQLAAAKMRPQPDTAVAARLFKSRGQQPVTSAVEALLLQAKNRNNALAAKTKPQMDAIVTALRLPPERMAAIEQSSVQGVGDSTISWDEWHARFAATARAPLLKAVSSCSDSSGSNTVSITVRRDHHLEVTLTRKSNAEFDRAVVDAYRALDGNSALEFPSGSRRKAVTFLIDNSHATAGLPSGVKSKTSIGDKEHQRFRTPQ